jgi:hypothetical protein
MKINKVLFFEIIFLSIFMIGCSSSHNYNSAVKVQSFSVSPIAPYDWTMIVTNSNNNSVMISVHVLGYLNDSTLFYDFENKYLISQNQTTIKDSPPDNHIVYFMKNMTVSVSVYKNGEYVEIFNNTYTM